jgi:hypothetical protein
MSGEGEALGPKSSTDLDGWDQITCWQAEIVRRGDLTVASSRTDMDTPDVFTEWWTTTGPHVAREVPVLREYRDRDGCRHYLAHEPSKSAEGEA